jgi:hypothetical protein
MLVLILMGVALLAGIWIFIITENGSGFMVIFLAVSMTFLCFALKGCTETSSEVYMDGVLEDVKMVEQRGVCSVYKEHEILMRVENHNSSVLYCRKNEKNIWISFFVDREAAKLPLLNEEKIKAILKRYVNLSETYIEKE